MNNEEDFDKEIKAKADGHAEVPPPEVWERIKDKRKKRIAPFWIFLNEKKWIISIALLVIIAGGFVYQNINKIESDNPLAIELDKKLSGNANKTDDYKSEKVKNTTDIKKVDGFMPEKQNAISNKPPGNITETLNSNSLNLGATEAVVKHKSFPKKSFIKNPSVNMELTQEQIQNSVDSIESSTDKVNPSLTLKDSSLSAMNHTELPAVIDSVSPNTKPDSSSTPPPVVTDSSTTKWSVELIYGYDIISNKFYTANGNQTYFNIINEHEKVNNGFTISLKAGYNLNPHLKLKSGFSYSYFSSEFKYEYNKQTFLAYTGMINAYIISPFNSPQQITFYGTRIDTLKMSYAFNHSKKIRFYNIPFTVNYCFPVKRFKFGASAGVGFNLVTGANGKYLQSDLITESELSNKRQSAYKSSYGFYGIGNISVCFQFSKKIYLMAEPEMRIPFSNITKNEAGITQKINTLSLQTGIGIEF